MLVIADNTPLRYLILLGYVDILPALYGHVIIPHAVLIELQPFVYILLCLTMSLPVTPSASAKAPSFP
jgi:predicted nucleic acid-binding protein